MPEPLARLALANKRVVYDLLFQAAAETFRQVAANPKRLGADMGGLMVLHTWGQRLQHHPHVHCVVPMGGLPRTGPGGSTPGRASSSRFPCCGRSFGASSSPVSARRFARAASLSRPARAAGNTNRPFAPSSDPSIAKPGWSMRSHPLAARPTCCTTSRATPTGWPSPITGSSTSPPHRLVSVEGLSPRQSDPHAHARRRRVSSTLSPPRAAEALRPHPVLRLPRFAHADPRAGSLSPGARGRPTTAGRTACDPTSTRLVAVSSLRSAHAPHRTTDRTTALPPRPPRRIVHDTS